MATAPAELTRKGCPRLGDVWPMAGDFGPKKIRASSPAGTRQRPERTPEPMQKVQTKCKRRIFPNRWFSL